jgi:hypothetical protein
MSHLQALEVKRSLLGLLSYRFGFKNVNPVFHRSESTQVIFGFGKYLLVFAEEVSKILFLGGGHIL